MKLLADNSKPVVRVPADLEPAEAQEAPVAMTAEKHDAAVVVPVPPDRTKGHDGIFPLLFGVGGSEGEEFRQGGGAKTLFVHLLEGFFRADETVEVEKLQLDVCLGGLS